MKNKFYFPKSKTIINLVDSWNILHNSGFTDEELNKMSNKDINELALILKDNLLKRKVIK